MRGLVIACFCLASLSCFGQTRALFLGNSYTNSNNLANMVSSLAENAGEELYVDTNTPGGYTLNGHSTNANSLGKIESGDWDFVILQEQSQLPSFPEGQFMSDSYAYAEELNDHILEYNPCAETMFYMTWGRENGDAGNCENWPPVCTYEGMDDLLAERYQLMASDLDGVVSPVGKVWRYLRENNPEVDLYTNDGSHPSLVGSYAAAVCFYSSIYRADPLGLTEDLGVDSDIALTIRSAVHEVVFSDLEAHLIGTYDLEASFEVEILAEESSMNFVNTSENANEYLWLINGQEYTSEDVYLELLGGIDNATVTLTVINECDTVSTEEMIFDFLNSVSEFNKVEVSIYPNPTSGRVEFSQTVRDIRVYSLNGGLVKTVNGPNSFITLKNLPEGEFILEFFVGDDMLTDRIMINRR